MSSFSSSSYKVFTKEIIEKDNISQLNSYLELVSTTIKVVVALCQVVLLAIKSIGEKVILCKRRIA